MRFCTKIAGAGNPPSTVSFDRIRRGRRLDSLKCHLSHTPQWAVEDASLYGFLQSPYRMGRSIHRPLCSISKDALPLPLGEVAEFTRPERVFALSVTCGDSSPIGGAKRSPLAMRFCPKITGAENPSPTGSFRKVPCLPLWGRWLSIAKPERVLTLSVTFVASRLRAARSRL